MQYLRLRNVMLCVVARSLRSPSSANLFSASRRCEESLRASMAVIGAFLGLDHPRLCSTPVHAQCALPDYLPAPARGTMFPLRRIQTAASAASSHSKLLSSATNTQASVSAANVSARFSQEHLRRAPRSSTDGDVDDGEDFLSRSATFEGLRLHPDVIAAMRSSGLRRPSQVIRTYQCLSATAYEGCQDAGIRAPTTICCRPRGPIWQSTVLRGCKHNLMCTARPRHLLQTETFAHAHVTTPHIRDAGGVSSKCSQLAAPTCNTGSGNGSRQGAALARHRYRLRQCRRCWPAATPSSRPRRAAARRSRTSRPSCRGCWPTDPAAQTPAAAAQRLTNLSAGANDMRWRPSGQARRHEDDCLYTTAIFQMFRHDSQFCRRSCPPQQAKHVQSSQLSIWTLLGICETTH